MDHFQGKKPKTEGVSRSGRVRKKSSKLMDFESPDEIDKNYKKHGAAAMRKIESFDGQPPRKAGRSDEMTYPRPDFENFDMLAAAAGAGPPLGTGEPHSGSEFDESEYDLPAHTESSMDSADNSDNNNNNSDFDENPEHGVFKRLDTDTSKKRLIIKDGRIMKTDKASGKKGRDHADGSPPKFKPINVNRGGGRTTGKKTPTAKNSPGGGGGGGASSVHHAFDNTSGMISPPNSRNKGVGSGGAPDYKVSGIRPIDVAAHLKLLGESLTIIGERLKEHEGQIAVSGSLSVLLDSLLCALGPLLCLTQQVPELRENCCTPEQLMSTLDNVAFIMPGL